MGFHEMDLKLKVMAKSLREKYKSNFVNERFWQMTSTKSESKQLLSLSCYPESVRDSVLKDGDFKRFVENNNLKIENQTDVKKGYYFIRMSIEKEKIQC